MYMRENTECFERSLNLVRIEESWFRMVKVRRKGVISGMESSFLWKEVCGDRF